MNWRLPGVIAALCLTSACKDDPVGKMEPIPRPPDMPASAPKAEAPKPARPAEPPADPSKVVLRWKLTAPTAFRLTTTGAGAGETSDTFVLQKADSGDYLFRIAPQAQGVAPAQGTMSERGFVLDGLSGPVRNTAALVLELPRDPVGPGTTWSLGTDLVDLSGVQDFVEQKAERHNQVKLASLTPGDNGEQVATLEYELSERVSGQLRSTKATPPSKPEPAKKGKKGKEEAAAPSQPQVSTSEVRVTGRGEFLVKAGRWRSWEGTLTQHAEGPTLPGAANGEQKLRLTPLDAVPPELLQPQAKK